MRMTQFGFYFFSCFMTLLCLTSCDSESSDFSQEEIRMNIQDGAWMITKFVDSGQDETSDFAGYAFEFNSSGVLTADNGMNIYSGNWSVSDDDDDSDDDSDDDDSDDDDSDDDSDDDDSDDDSDDDDSYDDDSDDLDFNIVFQLTNDFEDLNDDWDIISHSATKIELIDVSGGNGGTDYLTFEKK